MKKTSLFLAIGIIVGSIQPKDPNDTKFFEYLCDKAEKVSEVVHDAVVRKVTDISIDAIEAAPELYKSLTKGVQAQLMEQYQTRMLKLMETNQDLINSIPLDRLSKKTAKAVDDFVRNLK